MGERRALRVATCARPPRRSPDALAIGPACLSGPARHHRGRAAVRLSRSRRARAGASRVGAIVRVRLHGRRVRGLGRRRRRRVGGRAGAVAAAARGVVGRSAAPTSSRCAESVAYRCAGPLAAVLRSASPPNNVAPARSRRAPAPRSAYPMLDAPASDVDRAADELPSAFSVHPTALTTPNCTENGDGVGGRGALAAAARPAPPRRRVARRARVDDRGHGRRHRAAAFQRWLAARGTRAVLLHSDVPAAARTDAWRVAAGGACVVVGGRSAAFAPVPDLACAVVLDDGDEALAGRALAHVARARRAVRAVADGRWSLRRRVPGADRGDGARARPRSSRRRAAIESGGLAARRGGRPARRSAGRRPARATGSWPRCKSAAAAGDPSVLVLNRRGRCAPAALRDLSRAHPLGRARPPAARRRAPSADRRAAARPGFCAHCGAHAARRAARRGAAARGGARGAAVPGADVDGGRRRESRRCPTLQPWSSAPRRCCTATRCGGAARPRRVRRLRPRAARAALPRRGAGALARGAGRAPARRRRPSRQPRAAPDPRSRPRRRAGRGAGDPQLVADAELERRRGVRAAAVRRAGRGAGQRSRRSRPRPTALAAIEKPGTGITVDVTDQRVLVRAPDADVLARALAARRGARPRPHGGVRVAADPPRI